MKFYTLFPNGNIVDAVKAHRVFTKSLFHHFQPYVLDLMGEKVELDPKVPMGIGTEILRQEDNEVEILSFSQQYGAVIVVLFDASGEAEEPKVTMPGRFAELADTAVSRHTGKRIAETWLLSRGGILSVDDRYYEIDTVERVHTVTKDDVIYRMVQDKAVSR